jgi:hypothetical protein
MGISVFVGGVYTAILEEAGAIEKPQKRAIGIQIPEVFCIRRQLYQTVFRILSSCSTYLSEG